MELKELINNYDNVCLYLSSGDDFNVAANLDNLSFPQNSLIIMCEIDPDNYKKLNKLFTHSKYKYHDFYDCLVELDNIEKLDNLKLKIDKRLYSLNKSIHLNEVYKFNLTYSCEKFGYRFYDIAYIVSENATFVMDYLIKNNLFIDTIYINGIRGSKVNCSFISKVLDKLNTKRVYTTIPFVLNRIDYNVEKVYKDLQNIKFKTYNCISLNTNLDITIIDTTKCSDIEEYNIIDNNGNLSITINNINYEIDITKPNSLLNVDTTINGYTFNKNNEIDNIIGLDIIMNLGIHIENNKLSFLSIENSKYIDFIRNYDNFLYVLNKNKKKYLLTSNSSNITTIANEPINSLGIDNCKNILSISNIDIKPRVDYYEE